MPQHLNFEREMILLGLESRHLQSQASVERIMPFLQTALPINELERLRAGRAEVAEVLERPRKEIEALQRRHIRF